MIDLEACRLIIKGFKTREEVYEYADKIQRLGSRVCPRNIYRDEHSLAICTKCQPKSICRKRYATCFKKYFNEVGK